ncbi:MAG: transcriptional regulator, partial [Candidatus Sulfotelmatobacter sp.]
VDDPEGYHTELTSELRTTEGQLDVWLLQGSERFVSDPEVSEVLIKAAREKDTRRCLLLLGAILDTPGLAERLLEALRPDLVARGNHRQVSRGQEDHGRAAEAEGRRTR